MREYAVVFAVAAAVTYLLTPIVQIIAVKIGALAVPRDRDVHTIPTPRLGGVAMLGGVAVAMLVARNLPALQEAFRESDVAAVLLAGAIVCALGVVDDRFGLDALTKLAGQTVAAGVMTVLGVQLHNIFLPGLGGGGSVNTVVLSPALGVPLTVLLALVTINAINFIDGLDGLAAGVMAIAALALFAFTYHLSEVQRVLTAAPPTLICAVLAGACIGFLPHNFNPARIFMGDSGSMLIGVLLAGATTSAVGRVDFSGASTGTLPFLLPVAIPAAVLLVPFADLLFAVVRRTRAGRSPFSPDKMHLHHRLLEIGHSQTRAVLIMYLWTALLAFGAVAASVSPGPVRVVAVTAALAVVALVASLVPRWRSTPAALHPGDGDRADVGRDSAESDAPLPATPRQGSPES